MPIKLRVNLTRKHLLWIAGLTLLQIMLWQFLFLPPQYLAGIVYIPAQSFALLHPWIFFALSLACFIAAALLVCRVKSAKKFIAASQLGLFMFVGYLSLFYPGLSYCLLDQRWSGTNYFLPSRDFPDIRPGVAVAEILDRYPSIKSDASETRRLALAAPGEKYIVRQGKYYVTVRYDAAGRITTLGWDVFD